MLQCNVYQYLLKLKYLSPPLFSALFSSPVLLPSSSSLTPPPSSPLSSSLLLPSPFLSSPLLYSTLLFSNHPFPYSPLLYMVAVAFTFTSVRQMEVQFVLDDVQWKEVTKLRMSYEWEELAWHFNQKFQIEKYIKVFTLIILPPDLGLI